MDRTIHLARDGENVGSFSEQAVKAFLADGSFTHADLGWYEGLNGWITLAEIFPPQPPQRLPPTKAQRPAKEAMPVTQKQIDYLESFGVVVPPGLTKFEASAMLDQLTSDPQAKQRKALLAAKKAEEELAERSKHFSYYQKKVVMEAEAEVAEMEAKKPLKDEIKPLKEKIKSLKELLKNLPSQIEELEDELVSVQEEIENLPNDLKMAREDLKEQTLYRLDYWKYAFKEDSLGEAPDGAQDVYDRIGRLFKSPPQKVILELLSELDAENPEWDRVNIDAFFQRLAFKYPEFKR
jgi:hypothetical protein